MLFDIDVKPSAYRFPKVLFIYFILMEALKKNSAFFQIIDIEFHILTDYFKRVTIYNWDVVDDFVSVELKVITELLNTLFVFVEATIKAKKFIILLVVLFNK